VIQQYDHEVQGGSVIKPLVGAGADGPSDAAVVRPRLNSQRAIVVANGLAPQFSDFDTYHAATAAMDEAIRNCVAVGADPSRIAVLDNFCWGHTDRPETLGALVRAALACHDLALAWQVPFISGKDSLHNEFSYQDGAGQRQTIRIPHTLLISALGQVERADRCVTMDFKQAGNRVLQVGGTYCELGGSHLSMVRDLHGGQVPTVRPEQAWRTFQALHRCIAAGWIAACHDLSEGGLAVSVSEMAFAGRLGVELQLTGLELQSTEAACDAAERQRLPINLVRLFAESNSRFLLEVRPEHVASVLAALNGVPCCELGAVTASPRVVVRDGDATLIDLDIETLRRRWREPLNW
jgi:phosphoribosylformylglycinamidine synthase